MSIIGRLLSTRSDHLIELKEWVYHGPTCRTGQVVDRYVSDQTGKALYHVVWKLEDKLIDSTSLTSSDFVKAEDVSIFRE